MKSAAASLPAFPSLTWHAPFADEPPELDWLEAAIEGQPTAMLWSAAPGLVAPLSYRRHAALQEVCEAFARQGLAVRLRRSGGGVVPQGPGILNLSLAYATDADAGVRAEGVYDHLCARLAAALGQLGIVAEAQAVAGSFCDGRFNLAVAGRKICGTAQYWRRRQGRQAVLAHALLLVDGDAAALTARANAFEDALQSGRRYDAQAIVTVRTASGRVEADLETPLAQALAAALAVPLIRS